MKKFFALLFLSLFILPGLFFGEEEKANSHDLKTSVLNSFVKNEPQILVALSSKARDEEAVKALKESFAVIKTVAEKLKLDWSKAKIEADKIQALPGVESFIVKDGQLSFRIFFKTETLEKKKLIASALICESFTDKDISDINSGLSAMTADNLKFKEAIGQIKGMKCDGKAITDEDIKGYMAYFDDKNTTQIGNSPVVFQIHQLVCAYLSWAPGLDKDKDLKFGRILLDRFVTKSYLEQSMLFRQGFSGDVWTYSKENSFPNQKHNVEFHFKDGIIAKIIVDDKTLKNQ